MDGLRAAGSNQEAGTLAYIAQELGAIRHEYQHNGRAFPHRLNALRLLAVSGYQALSGIDAGAPVDNALLMTYATAAKRLCISESSLYRLIKSGELATVRIGSSSRITEEDLQAYVATLDRRRGLHEQEEIRSA